MRVFAAAFVLPFFLAACSAATDFVRTGPALPPLADDAEVAALLMGPYPPYAEIGTLETHTHGKDFWLRSPLELGRLAAEAAARRRGGDCVILAGERVEHETLPMQDPAHIHMVCYYQRWIVGRLQELPTGRVEP